jgi:hypothetical protein
VCHRHRLDGVACEVQLLRTYESGACWDIEYLDGTTEEAVPVAELVMKEKAAAPSTIVKLNVGGTCFDVSRTTLMSQKDSMLEAMFSGRHNVVVDKDDSGRYFIDRDGDMFKYVLCFLRAPHTFTLEGLSPRDTQRAREELEYFQFPFLNVPATGTVSAELEELRKQTRYARENLRVNIQNENSRWVFSTVVASIIVPIGFYEGTSGFISKQFVRFPPSTINEDEPPYVSCKWDFEVQYTRIRFPNSIYGIFVWGDSKILLPCAFEPSKVKVALDYLHILAKYYGVTVDERIKMIPSCDHEWYRIAVGPTLDGDPLECYRIAVALQRDLFGIPDGHSIGQK